MRRFFGVLVVLLFLTPCSICEGLTQDANVLDPPAVSELLSSNALVGSGKPSFHLKVSFEINDFKGKPFEKGIAEEWWTEHGDPSLLFEAPSFGKVHGTDYASLPNDMARRSLDLASVLLGAIRDPTTTVRYRTQTALVQAKKFGSAELSCAVPRSAQLQGMTSPPMYCFTENIRAIRLVRSDEFTLTRNSLVKFGGSVVAKEDDLEYLGKVAITGHVDVLESFHPADAGAAPPSDPGLEHASIPDLPGSVVAGKKIGGDSPVYPEIARERRVSGAVILGGEISKGGDISFLFPVASSSDLLTESAMDAVKTWKYRPYLLNGKPTNCSTTITVNYNLLGRVGY